MQTKNKKTLMFRTMSVLLLFSSAILISMHFIQVLFLNYFYEKYKIKEVNTIVSKIDKNIKNMDEYLDNSSIEYQVCIEWIRHDGTLVYNENTKGCLFKKPSKKTLSLIDTMITSTDRSTFYKINNPIYNSKSLLYGLTLKDGSYVLINNQLESLDRTYNLINSQVIYVLILLIVIAVVLSFFISNSITKPIREITDKAKKLASGNFDVDFTSSSISEIDELSETLNYTKNELEKTNDYRKDLMANVGHDLKTPLTLIKSYAEMVRDISYKNDLKREEHLNVIINESDRLNELVGDILTLSKIERSDDVLNIEEYDLDKEIRNIVHHFEILSLTENYHFIIDSKETIIKADKNKINQVIYNLLSNAINYTGDDMTVYINVKHMKDAYKVEIKDTGKGIKKEDLKSIWDRYYKTEKKHKRNVVGTGLGLSIVKRILEKHNYKYGVNSKKGKGTSFYFIIKK